MKILGVDYGRRKVGLAVSDGKLAEPLKVIRVGSIEEALERVSRVSKVSGVSRVVIGVSEKEIAKEQRGFGRKLEKVLGIPVSFQDETLSTQEAQELSIEAGIGRKKRRSLEDAYSAALILQSFIDNRNF